MSDQENVLAAWYDIHNKLEKLKKEEVELREKVVQAFFPQEGGTKDLGNGYKLKCTKPTNYKLDNEQVPRIQAHIEQMYGQAAGWEFNQQLFRTKYELSVGFYNKASSDIKKLLESALEIKPGRSQLTVEKKEK